VLQKAGFVRAGEVDDEHDGRPLRVTEWRLVLDRPPDAGVSS
jgi:hypothetical protein